MHMRPMAAVAAVAVFLGTAAACGRDDHTPAAGAPTASVVAPHAPVSFGDGSRASLRVTSIRRQRMAGFGTAVAADSPLDPLAGTTGLSAAQIRQLDALVLRAGIRLVRIFGPGQLTGPAGAQVWTADDSRLRLMARLKGRGVRFLFTGQGAPAELIVGGGVTGPLVAGREERYAEFLAACLEVAERAGTPFEFAAIGNEIDNDGDPGVTMTVGQAAAVTSMLAREVDRRRLSVKLVLGDTLNWRSTLAYAEAQASALAGRKAAFVATHGYGADELRPDLARFAAAKGLPLWMTEWVSSACPRGDCPDNPSIGVALGWARQIHDDLTKGAASAWFMFRGVADSTHGADGAIIVVERSEPRDKLMTTKRYPMMRQFTVAAPPGSWRLDTSREPSGDIRALAFSGPRRRSVVLTNLIKTEARLRVGLGPRGGRLSVWRTSASEDFRALLRRRVKRGQVNITLAPESVTTLVLRETR